MGKGYLYSTGGRRGVWNADALPKEKTQASAHFYAFFFTLTVLKSINTYSKRGEKREKRKKKTCICGQKIVGG